MKTLIRCGWLVSMDPKIGTLRDAELLVEDDRISAVGRNLGTKADREIDARNMIAMPLSRRRSRFCAKFRRASGNHLAPGILSPSTSTVPPFFAATMRP